MYTQCPDCATTFPVTARVLQQAAGRVSCGRCGHSFNALERLSEDPPGRDDSRSMLDALEALAGPEDIRIEDTGVEWRVIDEDDVDAAESDAAEDDADAAVASSVRWHIEDTAQHSADDNAAVSETGDDRPRRPEDEGDASFARRGPQQSLQLPASGGGGQLRYDDDTPLPENFGQDEEPAEPPRRRAEDFLEARSPEFDERQVDLALGDPGEWMALLDELGTGEDEPAPADEQPAAAGDADTGEHEAPAPAAVSEQDAEAPALRRLEEEPGELELAADTDTRDGGTAAAQPAGRAIAQERDPVRGEPPELARPAAARTRAAGSAQQHEDEPASAPLTEEERTISRQIDRHRLRFAQEQDALGSSRADAHRLRERPHVETIIMEGDFVRTALEADEGEAAAAGSEAGQDVTWLEQRPPAQAEEQRAEPRSRKALAGVVVLGILLLVQVVHAYREALATNDAFVRAAAPVYRLLGAPLVPSWDARGWQFQETSGGTDATGQALGVSSQIANVSDRPLPYPLIYLSLTDRWEEPVGASVLEPAAYLTPEADAASVVPPGASFTANITIRSLSPDASGFKLNVCYPADAGRLRCAIEDFRK